MGGRREEGYGGSVGGQGGGMGVNVAALWAASG